MGSSAWRMERTQHMDQSSSILGHRIGTRCPGSSPQPVASHSVTWEWRSGLVLIHQALWFHLFQAIFSASPRVHWEEEGSGCLNLFPCQPPLTRLAPALGPPLLPSGIRVIAPGCLQRKHLITDRLESSHPRCWRIVCVLRHPISISAHFFCFCGSYNTLSQSWWLNTAQTCYLTVPNSEVRRGSHGLKPWCQQDWFFLGL